VNVLLLRPRQVWTAPASVRAQSVAKGAINAELILACLRGLGIACKGIAIVRGMGRSCGQQQKTHIHERDKISPRLCLVNIQKHESPIKEFAAFYAKGTRSSLWKSWAPRRQ
jgi:hypothetical protein